MSANFQIDSIPEWLIIKTFTKMSPKEFMRFQQTNKQMYTLCNSRENLFCIPMIKLGHTGLFIYSRFMPDLEYENVSEAFPYRIKCQQLIFRVLYENREARMVEFVKMIRERQITCGSLSITCNLTNVEEQVKWCIQATRPSRLSFSGDVDDDHSFLSHQMFPVSLFENLSAIRIDTSEYRNEDLLLLKAKEIYMETSNITSYGINQLLRQWFANKREIEKIHLNWLKGISEEEIIENLAVCVVYTKEWHQHSRISHMDLSEVPDDTPSFYQLIRAGDLDGMLRLPIDDHSILIELCNPD